MAKMIPNMDSAIDRAHLVTADGRRVDHVESVPGAHVWRWRVYVGGESYAVNVNGRRYANVESEFDLMIEEVKNREKHDCMPDVLGAIRCVREGCYSDIKRCNKNYLRNDTTEGVAVDTSALKNY